MHLQGGIKLSVAYLGQTSPNTSYVGKNIQLTTFNELLKAK